MFAWGRIPRPLLVGLAMQLGFTCAQVVHYMGDELDATSSWPVLEFGFGVGSVLLVLVGAIELVGRTRGKATHGAIVLVVSQLAQLALFGAWIVIANHDFAHGATALEVVRALQLFQSILVIATASGIGLASNRASILFALLVLAVLGVPPVAEKLVSWADTRSSAVLVHFLPGILLGAAMLFGAEVGARELAEPTEVRAEHGFARAERALWLRVIIAVTVTSILILMGVSRSSDLALYKIISIAAPIVDALALAGIARGALGVARSGGSPWLALGSATGLLWCVGVRVGQIPGAYELAFPRHDHASSSFLGLATTHDAAYGIAHAYSTTVPIVASAAIAMLLVAITQLARRRDLRELHASATRSTGAFVGLSIGALALTRYGITYVTAGDAPGFVLVAIAVAGAASIGALAIAAKLCAKAVTELGASPVGLPAATVIRSKS